MKTSERDRRRLAGIQEMIAKEVAEDNLRWVLLSFADDTFLGAAVVEALGITHAIAQTKAGNYNPGGSVLLLELPQDKLPPEEFRNRLLSRAEVLSLWPDAFG